MVLDIAIVPLLALLAVLLGRLVAKAGIPDFLGFILAGALVALMLPQVATAGSAALKGAATLGLVALMVDTGIGMSPHISGGRWREVAALSAAILACLVPAFLTAPMVMRGWADPALSAGRIPALAYQGALALAVIVTSVPFITKVLAHNRLLGTPFAATVLCTACTVDLVVWALVPVVIGIGSGGAPALPALLAPLLGTAALAGGSAAIVRAQASGTVSAIRLLFSALVPLVALACSFVAFFNVSVMVAGLILGLSLGRLRFRRTPLASRLGRAAAALLVPLYFAAVGLQLDLGEKLAPALLAIFFLWSTAIKAVLVTAAAVLLRYRPREALAFGFALNTRGGPGIALASVTFDAGVIGGATFVALIFASVATALLADRVLQLTIAGRARTSQGAAAPSHNAAHTPRPTPAEAQRVRIPAIPQPREHT